MHTHTRKPDPVIAWQNVEGSTLPEWAVANGITPQDHEQSIPLGFWLVFNERQGVVRNMSPEQFEAEYDPAS